MLPCARSLLRRRGLALLRGCAEGECGRGEALANARHVATLAGLEIGFKFLIESYMSHVEMEKPKYIKGASAAVNAIILLEIFLYPKRLVYLYFFIPIPDAFVGAVLIGADLWRVKKNYMYMETSSQYKLDF